VAACALAQNPLLLVCDATGDPRQIRSEGLSEQLGAIVVTCTGTPGATVNGAFTLNVSAPVTNKLTGERIDAVMTADTSTGTQAVGGNPLLVGPNTIVFGSFSFTMPSTGTTSFRFTNIRVNPGERDSVSVFLIVNSPAIAIRNNPVRVGITGRGLYAGGSNARIVCVGSPLPDEEINFMTLVLRGTQAVTMRVTEGQPLAFEPRAPNTTNGTRVHVRLSGFPSITRLFVPDFIAGSSALQPTSVGDLGVLVSGGLWGGPGTGLLLARVPSADQNGAGSGPLPVNPTGAFNSVTEVFLQGGSATITYEVIDAVPIALESAHVPFFVAIPPEAGLSGTVASGRVSLGPLSTIADAHSSAPVVRFRDHNPPRDCDVLRDCNASYFPKLVVDSQVLSVTAPAVRGFYQRFMRILNDSNGIMYWTTTITYKTGTGWLSLFPTSGINNASANLSFFPEKLTPGFYEATLVIDAGPVAGQRSLPVTLTVTQPPPDTNPPPGPGPGPQPPANPPRFWTVGNAANLGLATLAPGSLAVIEGTRLSGKLVEARFDGIAAQVLSSSDGRLTVLVPPDLGTRPNAQLQVTVDGVASEVRNVPIAIAAPAIFPDGVFNQDGFANKPDNAERSGNVLQVFATGLPLPSMGTISARIHDREITALVYAGPSSSPGVQQVNLQIPEDLPAMTTEVLVCGSPVTSPSQSICSAAARVTIRDP
jgi:uncharacterized protein (TIGR03437 family)